MENLTELFKDVMDKAVDYKEEMIRLAEIENRLKSRFADKKEEIKGLEKALGYSAISSEAKRILENSIYRSKTLANDICYILGINRLYENVK